MRRFHPTAPAQSRLDWLLQLRWVAFGGQLVVILWAALVRSVTLPLGPLFSILAAFALSNVFLTRGLKRRAIGHATGDWIAGVVMFVDLVILSVLLYLTGGDSNPFCSFYVVNVSLAAVLLHAVWAWGLTAVAVASFVALHRWHVPLPPESFDEALRTEGLIAAMSATMLITAYFVTRVSRALAEGEAELTRQRELRTRAERLQGLATLAAGAAHELGSPLSTIAVVAKELERGLTERGLEGEPVDDARLIRDEVSRCRRILDRMSRSDAAVPASRTTLERVLELALSELAEAARVDVADLGALSVRELQVDEEGLAMALRGVLQNALDASPPEGRVRIETSLEEELLKLDVVDAGIGMDAATRARALDPFFSTKEPGSGMGLGLFLVNSIVEREGGTLQIDSRPGSGTRVQLTFDLARSIGDETDDETGDETGKERPQGSRS